MATATAEPEEAQVASDVTVDDAVLNVKSAALSYAGKNEKFLDKWTKPLRDIYRSAKAPIIADFKARTEQLKIERESVEAPVTAAYNKALDPVFPLWDHNAKPFIERYKKAVERAHKDYEKSTAEARKTYGNAIEPKFTEFQSQLQAVQEWYETEIAPLREEFNKACEPHFEPFTQALAEAKAKLDEAMEAAEATILPVVETGRETYGK